MGSWEPVDIDLIDREGIGEEDNKWVDNLMNDLEKRFNEPRQFNSRLETSSDMDIMLQKIN